MTEFKPLKHQIKALEFARSRKNYILFMDPGLGKTITVLTDLVPYMDEGIPVVVFSTPRIISAVWGQELQKWTHTSKYTYQAINGTPKQRMKRIEGTYNVYGVSIDLAAWFLEHTPFTRFIMVIDESTLIKSNSSKRYKAIRAMIKQYDVQKVIALTGTPTPRDMRDIYTQTEIISKGILSTSYTQFVKDYFYPLKTDPIRGIVYKYGIMDGKRKEIELKLRDIALTLRLADYNELPDVIKNDIFIDFDEKLLKTYKKFAKTYVLEDYTAQNAGVLFNKLAQFSSGNTYDESKEVQFIHSQKLEALFELVDSLQNRVVVVYNFKSSFEAIKARAIKAGYTFGGIEQLEDYLRGRLDIFCIHPASAGHGLNLQYQANVMVWYDLTFNLEHYQQACARLYRTGQTRKTYIHHIVTKNTIDEYMLDTLKGKEFNQERFINSLKG